MGTRNLRDIGGYRTRDGRRTRWRTIFRSDCLDQLTDLAQAERRWGGAERYLVQLGRTENHVAELRNPLAEPGS